MKNLQPFTGLKELYFCAFSLLSYLQGVLTAKKGEKITFVFKSILADAESINLLFVSDRDSFLESFLFIKETIRLIFVEQTRLVFLLYFYYRVFRQKIRKKLVCLVILDRNGNFTCI